jgi:predicted Rossmann-fold nucleotide-binding protein
MVQGLFSVCVYCGSRPGVRPAYARDAAALGAALAAHGGWSAAPATWA